MLYVDFIIHYSGINMKHKHSQDDSVLKWQRMQVQWAAVVG